MIHTHARERPRRRRAEAEFEPAQCFRTRSVGGRCHRCSEPIEAVAHVTLTAKAVYCAGCCPQCAESQPE
jgi:hypothetical protein